MISYCERVTGKPPFNWRRALKYIDGKACSREYELKLLYLCESWATCPIGNLTDKLYRDGDDADNEDASPRYSEPLHQLGGDFFWTLREALNKMPNNTQHVQTLREILDKIDERLPYALMEQNHETAN